jgi:hypothetical protein
MDQFSQPTAKSDVADTNAFNPWEEQDKREVLENVGVPFEWKYGWSFMIVRRAKWNKRFQSAANRIMSRPDVEQFMKRVNAKGYKQTDADTAFWNKVQTEILVDGCIVGAVATNRDGTPMEFTRKNMLMLLAKFPSLASDIEAATLDSGLFEPEPTTEEKLGN